MKNLFKSCLVFVGVLTVGSVSAQNNSTDDTQLTVNVGQTYNIEIAQDNVAIDMNQPSHFSQGNDSGVQNSHIQVTSNSSYEVTVKTDVADFNGPSGSNNIAVSNVEVTIGSANIDLSGNQSTLSDATLTTQALSNAEQAVIVTDGGDLLRGFNATYSIPAANAVNFLNQDNGAYTTTVTYTITPL